MPKATASDERRAREEAQVHRHSDGDEKQPEQQPLNGSMSTSSLAVLAVGEDHAGEERAERHRQAHGLHQSAMPITRSSAAATNTSRSRVRR